VLPSLETPDDDGGETRPLSWQEIRFELMWTQHGGSGLGMSFAEVNDLDVDEIFWLFTAQRARRTKEGEALKRAGKR